MTRLHIAWANALYRLRLLGHWLYEATHEPADDGWADELHEINAQIRAERQAAADDTNPHTPVTTIHRAGIYSDDRGRTVVRDRWGTTVLGETPDPATEMEVSA